MPPLPRRDTISYRSRIEGGRPWVPIAAALSASSFGGRAGDAVSVRPTTARTVGAWPRGTSGAAGVGEGGALVLVSVAAGLTDPPSAAPVRCIAASCTSRVAPRAEQGQSRGSIGLVPA